MTQAMHQQNGSEPIREVIKPVTVSQQAIANPQLSVAVTQARSDPRALGPRDVLTLQRAMGNRVVHRLMQTERKGGLPDETNEQEANRRGDEVRTMPEVEACWDPVDAFARERIRVAARYLFPRLSKPAGPKLAAY